MSESPVREYVAVWAQAFDYGSAEKPALDTQYFAQRFRAYTAQDVVQMWMLNRERAPFEIWIKLMRVDPFEADRYGQVFQNGPTPWTDGA